MWEQLLMEILNNHRGKLCGVLFGLFFAILVLIIGFWRTLFIACCITVGYIIGKRFDENGSLQEIINRFFKES